MLCLHSLTRSPIHSMPRTALWGRQHQCANLTNLRLRAQCANLRNQCTKKLPHIQGWAYSWDLKPGNLALTYYTSPLLSRSPRRAFHRAEHGLLHEMLITKIIHVHCIHTALQGKMYFSLWTMPKIKLGSTYAKYSFPTWSTSARELEMSCGSQL